MKRKSKENVKRFLSVLLAVVMALFWTPGSALEIAAYAEETAAPAAEVLEAAGVEYSITVTVPGDWGAQIYCYAYDSSDGTVTNGSGWPGEVMTAAGDGTYSYVLDTGALGFASAPRVIFTNGSGVQCPRGEGILLMEPGSWTVKVIDENQYTTELDHEHNRDGGCQDNGDGTHNVKCSCGYVTAEAHIPDSNGQCTACLVYLTAPAYEIYAVVSETWDNVCCYAYAYDESANDGVWPGHTMEKKDNGVWHYTLQSLTRTPLVIFSSGGDSPRYPADGQPGMELNVPGAWIFICDDQVSMPTLLLHSENCHVYRNGACVVCGEAQHMVAQVGEKTYGTIDEAWDAAAAAYTGTPVTITLLDDAAVTRSSLYVNNGVEIILNGGYTVSGVIDIVSGSLTLNGGTIANTSGNCIEIYENGQLILNDGMVTASDIAVNMENGSFAMSGGCLQSEHGSALRVDGEAAQAEISGGTLKGINSVSIFKDTTVTITGGCFEESAQFILDASPANIQISGGTFAQITMSGPGTLEDILADGYAYYEKDAGMIIGSAGVTDLTNVTVKAASLKITTQPQGKTIYYGAAETLRVAASVLGTPAYQWYEVTDGAASEIPGADQEELYLSQFAVGEHQIFCRVSLGKERVDSDTVKVTVEKAVAEFTASSDKEEYAYGETITITGSVAQKAAQLAADARAAGLNEPRPGQVAAYEGETQVSAAAGVLRGEYTLTVDTKDLGAGTHALTVKVIESDVMTGAEANVTVKVDACQHPGIADGKCTVCGEIIAAQVEADGNITYYTDVTSAWSFAQGKTAVVTMLQSQTISSTLNVPEGSSITLSMADGVSLESDTKVSDTIEVSGTFTLENGILKNNKGTASFTRGNCLWVIGKNANAAIKGGTLTAEYGYAVHVYSGKVIISGGSFSGKRGLVTQKDAKATLSGGAFTGPSCAISSNNQPILGMLAAGCCYRQDGRWLSNDEVQAMGKMSAGGTLEVLPIPVSIGRQPEHADVIFGYSESEAPELTVLAVNTGMTAAIAYQWFDQDGNAIEGATGKKYTVPTGLAEGEYQYYCAVTCDGYTVKSSQATVTVNPCPHTSVNDYGKCTRCGKTFPAEIDGVYYDDFQNAWNTAIAMEGEVTIRLYTSYISGGMLIPDDHLTVPGGVSLRLEKADGKSSSWGLRTQITVEENATLILNGCVVCSKKEDTPAVQVNGTLLTENAATDNHISCIGFYRDATKPALTIGANGKADLRYCQVDGILNAGSRTIADVQADALLYAFQILNDSKYRWVTEQELTGNSITGRLRMSPTPLKITKQPAAAAVEYGYTEDAPVLSVEAVNLDGTTDGVTYQWYQAGETGDTAVAGGTDAALTIPAGLAEGEYQFYCAVVCDGYTVKSDVAAVTVKPCSHESVTDDGECERCHAVFAAKVEVDGNTTYYTDITSAWNYAEGKTATVTMLQEQRISLRLLHESGDLTLNMKDGVKLSGDCLLISVFGGKLTLEDCTLETDITPSGTNPPLYVCSRSSIVDVRNCTMTTGSARTCAIDVRYGTVNIYSGTFGGKGDNGQSGLAVYSGTKVKLYGGTFSGVDHWDKDKKGQAIRIRSYSKENIKDILADGFTYQSGGAWLTEDAINGKEFIGTLEVVPAPVKITEQTLAEEVTYSYAEAAAPVLTVTAETTSTAVDKTVTYQWLDADGNAIDGATGASYTIPTGLDAGTYTYSCNVRCDGYTQQSRTITVTVKPLPLPEITLSEDSFTYNGREQKPAVMVSGLTEGTDYTLSYTRNGTENVDFTSAGEIAVTAAGMGNHGGTVEKTYIINKAVPVIEWSSPAQELIYTGEEAAVTAPDVTLVNNEVFNGTITYSYEKDGESHTGLPVDAGTYTIKASVGESDNYTAAESNNTLTIKKATPAIAFVSDYDPNRIYNGQAIADPTADNLIITGADYKDVIFSWSDEPVNAGIYTLIATIPEAGNTEKVEITKEVTISPKPVTAVVIVTPDRYVYTGSAITPAVTVKDGETVINKNEYDVAYEDNINVGEAAVAITDKDGGNYIVSGSAAFSIIPADISRVAVTVSRSYAYNGTVHTPDPTVTLGGKTLVKDTDYTVSYTGNVNAGTATVTVTGMGNYTGTAEGSFTIAQATLTIKANDQTITYGDSIAQGTDQVAAIGLQGSDVLDSITLIAIGEQAAEENSIDPSGAVIKNSGVNVTANYQLNYQSGKLTIERLAIPVPTAVSVLLTYNGKEQIGVESGTGYTLKDSTGTEAGTYTAIATPDSNHCWEDGSTEAKEIVWSIVPAVIEDIQADGYTGTYDGEAHGITVTGYPSGVTVQYGTEDGTYDLTENPTYTDAGSYTVYYRLTSPNYETVTGSAVVTIEKKEVTVSITADGGVYNGEPFEASAEPEGVVEDETVIVTLTYTGQGGTIGSTTAPTDVGTYTVTAVIPDSNYELTGPDSKDFTITPAGIEDAEVTVDGSYTYTGTGHTPDPTVTLGGKTLLKDTDYTVSYDGNVNAGTATVTVTGIGNYTGEAAGSFTIGKAIITDVSAAVDSVKEPEAQDAVQSVVTDGSGYSAAVTWEPADSQYGFNTAYTATLTLTPDGNHVFGELSPEGWTAAVGDDGTVTLSKTFPATRKEKLTSLDTAPIGNVTLTTHTDRDGVIARLPRTVNAVTETGKTVPLTLSWNCETFDTAPNAENTFTWTVTDIGSYDAGGVTLTGTIKVTNPKALPVSITGTNREITYNGAAVDVKELFTIDENAGAATYDVTNVTGEGTLDGSILTVTRAGTFTITVNTAAKGIYAAGTADATLTVNPKTLVPHISGITGKIYDGTANAPDGLYIRLDGAEKDDDVTASADYSYDSCDAGKRTITADSITLGGEKAGCYILFAATAAAEGSIQQAVLTITATHQTITYGDSIIQGTDQVEAIGLQGSDALDSIILTATGDQAAEENSIEPSDAVIKNGDTDVTTNYQINYQSGRLTIVPAIIEDIQADDYTGIYDGKAHGITVTGYPSGVIVQYGTEDGTYDLMENPTYTDAGSYTVYYRLTSPNYETVIGSAVVTIEKKEVTVSITADGGVYNGKPFEASAEPEGVVEDETVIVTLTYTGQGGTIGSTTAPTDVGTYTVTAAIPDSNYELTGPDSKDFTITPAGIEDAEVTVDGSYTYTGTGHTPDPTVTLGGKTLLKDTDYTVSYDGNVNAGTATVTVTGIGNYTGEVTGEFIIAPKPITVTVTPNGGVYGGEITGATAVLNDVVTGDAAPEVTLTYTGTANDGTEVDSTETPQKAGTYTVTASIPEGSYILTGETAAQFQVAGKPIRVTAKSVEVTYGDPAPELTYTVATEDLAGEDTLTGITVMRQEGENAGEYTVTPVQEEGANPNYEIELVSGKLTIQPKDIGEAEIVLGASLTANGQEQTQVIKSVTVKNSKGEDMEATYSITGNTAVEAGEYTMTITGTGNFTGTKEQSFVIAPKADVPETTVQSSEGTEQTEQSSEGTEQTAQSSEGADQTVQRGESVNQILGIEDYSVLWGIFIMAAGIVLFLITAAYAVKRKR